MPFVLYCKMYPVLFVGDVVVLTEILVGWVGSNGVAMLFVGGMMVLAEILVGWVESKGAVALVLKGWRRGKGGECGIKLCCCVSGCHRQTR